jgi:hypothetical protein
VLASGCRGTHPLAVTPSGRHSIWPSLHLVVVTLVSLLVGIATHLGWDAFTHSDGWVVLHVAKLCVQLGPFTAHRRTQYTSSFGGLVILAIWTGGVASGADFFDRTVLCRTATISVACGGLLAVFACPGEHFLAQKESSQGELSQPGESSQPKLSQPELSQTERSTATTLPRSSA